MLSSSDSSSVCGTSQQPWNVEAPIGQKVRTSLFYFTASHSDRSQERREELCRKLALIVDKSAKRNVTICEDSEHRQKEIYLSTGNALTLYLDAPSHLRGSANTDHRFIMKFES